MSPRPKRLKVPKSHGLQSVSCVHKSGTDEFDVGLVVPGFIQLFTSVPWIMVKFSRLCQGWITWLFRCWNPLTAKAWKLRTLSQVTTLIIPGIIWVFAHLLTRLETFQGVNSLWVAVARKKVSHHSQNFHSMDHRKWNLTETSIV